MARGQKRAARVGERKAVPAKARLHVADSGQVRVKASIGGEPYTSEDVRAFIATATSAVPDDFRFFASEMEEQFGLLYRIGWAVQDHHRRFREEGNPLYVWHAIAILNELKCRESIAGNGARIGELRRALDSGTPGAWSINTLREIEVREWIGDPLPTWIAGYLASTSTALIGAEPCRFEPNRYGRAVAQALGLSKKGGGKSAHTRLRDPTDRIRRHALRFMDEIAKLGGKITAAQVAEIFGVQIETVNSWRKDRVKPENQ